MYINTAFIFLLKSLHVFDNQDNFHMYKVEIPNVDTTYWCKGIKLSSVIEDIDYKKYYIVKVCVSITTYKY